MKILITGVAGFIGSKIAEKFIEENHEVFGVDDLSTGKLSNVNSKTHFLKHDLSDRKVIDLLPKECDFILHLAGQSSGEISYDDPAADLMKNTVSTLNLIEYGKKIKVKKFLYASSMSVYGNVPDMPVGENFSPNPISCYGISKLTSENYLKLFSSEVPFISLRMFNVYGPGQDMQNLRQGMVSIFISQAINNNKIQVKGSIERFRDFIYIDDVVDVWFKFTFNPNLVNLTVNLGTGIKTTVLELLETIKELNPKFNYHIKGSTPGDQKGIFSDNSLISSLVDLNPFTKLSDGLVNFYNSVK